MTLWILTTVSLMIFNPMGLSLSQNLATTSAPTSWHPPPMPWTRHGAFLISPYPKSSDYYIVALPKPPTLPKLSKPASTSVEVVKSMELPTDLMPLATETADIITKSYILESNNGEKRNNSQQSGNDLLLRPETIQRFRALFPLENNSKKSGNESEGLVFINDKFIGPVFKAKQINIFVDDPGIVHIMSNRVRGPVVPPFKTSEPKEHDGSFINSLNIFKKIYNSL